MDRLVYVAMSGARQNMRANELVSNNLSNADTTGFQSDTPSFKSLFVSGSGMSDRAYSSLNDVGVSAKQGALDKTGRPLDVAMKNHAWLSVTTPSGEKGYVKSASLHVNQNGLLVTHQGYIVNNLDGESVTVPADTDVRIDKDGGLSVENNGEVSQLDHLHIQNLPQKGLFKSGSGLIEVKKEYAESVSDASGSVMSGVLEKSNVSPIESMVNMISLSKNYEANINLISTAKRDSSSANQLLSVR